MEQMDEVPAAAQDFYTPSLIPIAVMPNTAGQSLVR